jgi:putative PIN family toxin of toxin-antitoxin system
MYQVVLDTNVLVAALRSKRGASYLLLDRFDSSRWIPNLTVALFLEYEAVLKRECPVFGLAESDIDDMLDAICSQAKLNRQYFIWRPAANDPNDDLVLEAAIASNCDFIITYNKRDFRASDQFGIQCLSPKEFLILIGELQ